jgi:hypothetical protein
MTMKRYFSIIGYCMTPFVISYTFWYVIGAGISASWDTANWTMDLKIVLTVWACVFALMMFFRLEHEK